jgi:hypothetical protein
VRSLQKSRESRLALDFVFFPSNNTTQPTATDRHVARLFRLRLVYYGRF